MKKLVALALIALSSTAFAESDWILVAQNVEKTYTVFAQRQSGELKTTRGGQQVYVGRFQIVDKAQTTFHQIYVKPTDCVAGFGQMTWLDMAGNFQFNLDFNLAGSTISAAEARILCTAWAAGEKAKSDASI